MEKTYDKNGKPKAGGVYDSYGFPLAANRAAAQLDANDRAKKLEGKRGLPKNVSSKPKKNKQSGLGMSESEKMLSNYEKDASNKRKKKDYGSSGAGDFMRGLSAIFNK